MHVLSTRQVNEPSTSMLCRTLPKGPCEVHREAAAIDRWQHFLSETERGGRGETLIRNSERRVNHTEVSDVYKLVGLMSPLTLRASAATAFWVTASLYCDKGTRTWHTTLSCGERQKWLRYPVTSSRERLLLVKRISHYFWTQQTHAMAKNYTF